MFYDLNKEDRAKLSQKIRSDIRQDLKDGTRDKLLKYFSDGDTYIRKAAYLSAGRIYFADAALQEKIIHTISELSEYSEAKVRQTSINTAGEIGIREFAPVEKFFDKGLFDEHHSVRNAVIGSIKKMGEKNPVPVLSWAKKYLHHPDKEIRREICHGIELRGRTHPEDILPLLKELQFDRTARVKNTLIHVLGQIAYKKGCLETVLEDLKSWENDALVQAALAEIIDVHHRYRNFAVKTVQEAQHLAYLKFPQLSQI